MNHKTHVPFPRTLVERLVQYMDQAPTGTASFKEVLVLRRDLEVVVQESNEKAQAQVKAERAERMKTVDTPGPVNGKNRVEEVEVSK